jgi:hypothetical protein
VNACLTRNALGNHRWDVERVSKEVARVILLLDFDQSTDVLTIKCSQGVDCDVDINVSGIAGISVPERYFLSDWILPQRREEGLTRSEDGKTDQNSTTKHDSGCKP